jgi:hypothetical protein
MNGPVSFEFPLTRSRHHFKVCTAGMTAVFVRTVIWPRCDELESNTHHYALFCKPHFGNTFSFTCRARCLIPWGVGQNKCPVPDLPIRLSILAPSRRPQCDCCAKWQVFYCMTLFFIQSSYCPCYPIFLNRKYRSVFKYGSLKLRLCYTKRLICVRLEIV